MQVVSFHYVMFVHYNESQTDLSDWGD